MAAQIGSTACDTVSGVFPISKNIVKTWHRPGLNGIGALDLAKGDTVYTVTASKRDTYANVETWLHTLQAYQGTVQQFTTDWAQLYGQFLIRKVSVGTVTAELPHGAKGVVELQVEKTV